MKRNQAKPLEIGDRVLIVGDHPWTGHSGTLIAAETLAALGRVGLRVRLDNHLECFVLHPEQLRRL